METCLPSKPLKSQTTVSPQITIFLKNSNSQRCGFDRRVQPRVAMHIFCNIFATFLQTTRFLPCTKLVTRYLKNSNSQTCGFDRQMGEMVVQGHNLQRIWSGYQIPKQAHLSAFLESQPHPLAQKQTSS